MDQKTVPGTILNGMAQPWERGWQNDRNGEAKGEDWMKKTSLLAFCVVLLFVGCATEKVAPNAVTLGVEYSWKGVTNCSNLSPAIKITGFPYATKKFSVRMVDLNLPTANHGGGTIANDGSGMIPAGAFDDYVGPCLTGSPHRFQFIVRALDEQGTVIGEGKATESFP
jgi:phosphatidylethanolamine-binding protein (PEBP) family uncharacterized protein